MVINAPILTPFIAYLSDSAMLYMDSEKSNATIMCGA